MEAEDTLVGVRRLLLDTNAAASVLEGEPTASKVWAVLRTARKVGVTRVVSSVTLAELLSKPGISASELIRREESCVSTEDIGFGTVAFDAAFALRVASHR